MKRIFAVLAALGLIFFGARSQALNTVEAPYIIADVAFQGPGSGITGLNINSNNMTYTAPLTGAVANTVSAKLAEHLSVLDFGAVPNNSAAAAANTIAIQAALNAPGQDPIYFPSGQYYVTGSGASCLTMTVNRNLIGAGARTAIIQGYLNGASTAILTLAFTNTGNNGAGTVRNFLMSDLSVANYTGNDALIVDTLAGGTVGVFSSVFERLNLYTSETTGGVAFHAKGQGFVFNTIRECTASGGIYLDGTADGNRILNNNCLVATANNWNISVNNVTGAYETTVAHNTTNGGAGGIRVFEGSQVKILYNQIEQGSNPITVSPFAQVLIAGSSGQPCYDCTVEGNNLGGATNVGTCLWLDYAINTRIRNNVFSGTGQLPTSQELNFTANAKYNYVYSDNVSYGSGSAPNYANTTRFKLVVADSGEGQFGVPKSFSGSNGWGAMSCFKDPDTEEVVLSGVSGGTTTAGTQIVALPQGFRPAAYCLLPAASSGGVFVVLADNGGNQVTCYTAASSNTLICQGVRFPARRGN